jgi:hypothetical protein
MEFESKKKKYSEVQKVKYIINKNTGNIVTSQHRAWNDTVRMAMWLELCAKPAMQKYCPQGNNILLWMDNCRIHHTNSIASITKDNGINMAYYPENMTAYLQVMDLVVNGPIKRHIRESNALRIFNAFQEYKANIQTSDSDIRTPFEYPKIRCEDGLKDLFDLYNDGFKDAKFRDSIAKCFISTGTIPIQDDQFNSFNMKKTTNSILAFAPSDIASLKTEILHKKIVKPHLHQQFYRILSALNHLVMMMS